MAERLPTRNFFLVLGILIILLVCVLADTGLILVGTYVARTQATPTPVALATPTRAPLPTAIPRATATRSATATPRLTLAPATSPAPAATPTQGAIAPTSSPEFPQIPPTSNSPPRDEVGEQATAMIPAARGDLAKLANLPRYRIDVILDPERLTLSGRQRMHYVNSSSDTLKDIVFRLYANARDIYGGGKLLPLRVEVGGRAVQPTFELDNTAMRLALPRPLAPGGAVDVTIDFGAQVPRDFGGSDKPGYGIFNFAEGVLTLGDWYPVLAVYKPGQGWDVERFYPEGDAVFSPAAFYTISMRVPEEWKVAATGIQTREQKNDDGTVTYHYVTGPVRDYFIALSRDFQVASEQVGATKINSFYLSADERGGRKALQIATESLKAYNQRFGTYPFTELDVVDAPLNRAAGVEWPGLVLIAKNLYADPDNRVFAEATSHEVAHQWWYSVVGNDQLDDPWLDEALATFSSGIWAESTQGQTGYQRYLDFWQRVYDDATRAGKDDVVAEPVSHFSGDVERYSAIVYEKGALFYANVRREIGDEAFFKGLQHYYQDHKYGVATSDDVLKAFQAVTQKDVRGIYQQWVLSAQK